MADEDLNTVFKVIDESSGPMAKMAKKAEKLSEHAERAKKAVGDLSAKFSKSEMADIAEQFRKREWVHPEKRKAEGVAEESTDSWKEEFRARRSRMRQMKFEDANERLVGRFASMASMLFASGHIKALENLNKYSESAQMTGMMMYSMGGKLGGVGNVLNKIGGFGSILAAGLEIGSSVLDAFGVDVSALGRSIKKYTVGLNEAERRHEAALNQVSSTGVYLSNKEKEAFAAVGEHATQERLTAHELKRWKIQTVKERVDEYESALKKSGKSLGGLREKDLRLYGAREAYDRDVMRAGAVISKSTGMEAKAAVEAVKERQTKFEAAEKKSLAASGVHDARQVELAEIAKKVANSESVGINSVLSRADAEITRKNAIASATGRVQNAITGEYLSAEEATKVRELANAAYLNRMDVQEDTFMRGAETEAKLQEATRKTAWLIKLHTPKWNATAEAQMKYTKALLVAAKVALQSTYTSEEMTAKPGLLGEVIGKVRAAKVHIEQHFHNPRFDIKQAFAEGFDPDRVAVAMRNDLSAIGERMLEGKTLPHVGGTF